MSRGLDAALLAALDAQHVTHFAILTMEFDSGTQYLTDCPFDVAIGGITYTAAQHIGSIEPFAETDTGVQGLKFTLSAVPQSQIAAALVEDIQGRRCTLGLVVVDDGVLRVDPKAWQGYFDMPEVEDQRAEDGEATYTVTAENAMIRWQIPRGWLSNEQDHREIYPGTTDRFHEFSAQVVEQVIAWPSAEFFKR